MANVTLVNRTKRPSRMLVLNLAHNVSPVRIENRTTEESRSGERRKRISSRLVPGSVRIPAGGEVEIDEAALQSPDVAAAIARRDVIIVRRETAPVAQPAPEPVGAGSKGRVRRRRGS